MTKPQQLSTLTEAVIALLNKSDLPATLTIEQCAPKLAMSMTSFRRKLSQEETTYKLIHGKFLNELCVQALLTHKVKIDHLALKLGYSERATFERAFRKKFGISPSQFRELSLLGSDKSSQQNLTVIAQHLPPMPESCQQLLQEKEQDSLDIQRVVGIVEQDPIFVGRVMGLASKAIYGKTPSNIHEAISRNLGINTVVNLAVVYGLKDTLQADVNQVILNQYTQAFLKAPKFFQLIRKSVGKRFKLAPALLEQVLIFALLGIFLLSHKQADKHELMFYSLQGMADLDSLNRHISKNMGTSIYSASSLMLSLWHIDANVIKQLTHLNKVSQQGSKSNDQDELLLFMLSCLYLSAKGYERHEEHDVLAEKATLLQLDNFAEIEALLFTAE